MILPMPSPDLKFNVFYDLLEDITVVLVHPWLTAKSLESSLSNAKGVILRTYGMGNFPFDNVEMMSVLE